MIRRRKFGIVIVVIALIGAVLFESQRIALRQQQVRGLGVVRMYPSWWWQRGVIFMFSDRDGWQSADDSAAAAYARRGFYVVGIDATTFMEQANSQAGCVYLPGVLEGFSRKQQRQIGMNQYRLPLLLGHGVGATLVYMAHLQAPPVAFAAAVGLNPSPHLALRTAFCDHLASDLTSSDQTVRVEALNPAVPLRLWADNHADDATRHFVQAASGTQTMPTVSSSDVFAAYQTGLSAINEERQRSGIADLPLIEVQSTTPKPGPFAIFYSGDGGWRDLDQTLAGVLADKGMPVVGVDVLSYYWHEKSPQQSAQDLARIIDHYQKHWHRDEVVLIGFSFGANVMPFLYNRLPAALRSRVKLISLLSPERATAFSVDPSAWLHFHSSNGKTPIAPELAALPANIVQCVYGQEEGDDSLCTEAKNIYVLRKPGGHHFDENYDRLADDILAAIH